ncbi:MAG: hypothetical protein Q9200_006754 [Gallowayella weberi]
MAESSSSSSSFCLSQDLYIATLPTMFSKLMTHFLLGLHVATAVYRSSNEDINWFPCMQNGTLPLTCGTLAVPLDYTNTTSNATLELQLVKVSAVKYPKKGSILFNPGGPGAGGRDLIAASAVPLQTVTGGTYDLIGFDPRGTSTTLPFSCFPDSGSRDLALASTRFASFLNASDTAIGQAWAARTVLAETCYQSNRDNGELIGTGFVARDMIQIVDALDEGGLLNYWGFSYGTALGATVAAMFPDRMGRVVLDGCLNPHDYYAGNDVEQTTNSDAGFDGFFEGCVTHPQSCAFAKHGTTAEELKDRFYNLLYSVKSKPYVVKSGNTSYIIDYSTLKGYIQGALYPVATWPTLALGLHGLLTLNDTAAQALASLNPFDTKTLYPNNGPDVLLGGIRGSDVTFRTDNLSSLYPLIEQFYAKSQIFGDVLSPNLLTYAQWPFHAKGAYTGDFRVKMRNPILLIGSDVDALTPLVSAQNASAGFEGSVVLQHGGYGVSFLSAREYSPCITK